MELLLFGALLLCLFLLLALFGAALHIIALLQVRNAQREQVVSTLDNISNCLTSIEPGIQQLAHSIDEAVMYARQR